jgi:hypothetical protein
MCLLSEWDENKERNCDICPGRKEDMCTTTDENVPIVVIGKSRLTFVLIVEKE